MNIPSNQSEEGKKRIEELDFLKALFILLMITFHLAYIGDGYPYLKRFVYTFHMPGFLIISGYLWKVHKPIKKLLSNSIVACRALRCYGDGICSYGIAIANKRPYTNAINRGNAQQAMPSSVRSVLVSAHPDNLWNALLFCLPMGKSHHLFTPYNLRNSLLCSFSIRNYLVYMCNVFPCWCSCSSKFTFLSYHIP